MHSEKITALDACGTSVERGAPVAETLSIKGHYDVVCIGEDGQIKWTDSIENLVVTVGKNDLLDKYFFGSAYTAAWYMGLVDNASFTAYAAGNTITSHSGWLEFLNYTISGSSTNRATVGWSTAASAGSKTASVAAFTISGAGGTVLGALMTTIQARNTASDGSSTGSGILYSAGTFTGGARSVISGDTLNVTYTASV
jgi:hypothetical protein